MIRACVLGIALAYAFVPALAADQAPEAALAAALQDVEKADNIAAAAPHLPDLVHALYNPPAEGGGEIYSRIALFVAQFDMNAFRPRDAALAVEQGFTAAGATDELTPSLLILHAHAERMDGHWKGALATYDIASRIPYLDPGQTAQILRARAIGSGVTGGGAAAVANYNAAWQALLAAEPNDSEATFHLAAHRVPPQPDGPTPVAVSGTHRCGEETFEKDLIEDAFVLVDFDVDAKGAIGNVRAGVSSGIPAADDAAIACVRDRWKDNPAMQDGVAVAALGQMAAINYLAPKPSAPAALVARGNIHLSAGRAIRAVEYYDAAIDLDPNYTEAYAGRAKAYDAAGQHDRATADRAKAAGLPPAP